jgi:hypothetical protein
MNHRKISPRFRLLTYISARYGLPCSNAPESFDLLAWENSTNPYKDVCLIIKHTWKT